MSVEEFRQFREAMNQRIIEAVRDVRGRARVGGSVVIPHLRRAVTTLDELQRKS